MESLKKSYDEKLTMLSKDETLTSFLKYLIEIDVSVDQVH